MSKTQLVYQQKLLQRLSPQQIQAIKMVESPTMEIEELIKQEVEANPALEVYDGLNEDSVDELNGNEDGQGGEDFGTNDDISLDDYRSDDDIPDYKTFQERGEGGVNSPEMNMVYSDTLQDFLLEQMRLRVIQEDLKLLVEYIIGNLDDDGYLRRTLQSLSDDFAFQNGKFVEDESFLKALQIVQSFDPPGVGAHEIRECLLLQLKRKEQTDAIRHAVKILTNNFEDFLQKRYNQIEESTGLSKDDIREAMDEIVRLNPKPGNSWENGLMLGNELIPDFIVENRDGDLEVSLNDENIPSLRVSPEFSNMLEDYLKNKTANKDKKDAIMFVKQKIDAAQWFIDSIKQRHETLFRTMSAIVEKQKLFFLEGDNSKLKPLGLKDIAGMTGYDVSTISRVSNSKYVQTDFGVFPLKYFFVEGTQTADGEDVTYRRIREIISEIVEKEDKQNPITDDQISQTLKEKGYSVARRTVAKYREQLNIPVARLRKKL